MTAYRTRREFLRDLGLSAAALPFVCNLPSLGFASSAARKQRMIVIFTPNGVVPEQFWPDEEGDQFTLKPIMQPFEPYKDKLLTVHGICDKIRGDGDNHMRGMGCMLTGIELFPGNIQGGSDTPAGWASGLSIDQEIKNFLQSKAETKTRFGSLEFGVVVPERADTWTRMVYSGPNKPVTPVDDPYQMFAKLYGRQKDQASLKSVLDLVQSDLKKVEPLVSKDDRRLLEEHATFVRQMEDELKASKDEIGHAVPTLEVGVKEENDNIPTITKMQTELLINSFTADFARVATFQFTNSVSDAKMRWLGISEGHHSLSHEPDTNEEAVKKLVKINTWYSEQIAFLVKRLAETPEPGGQGNLLDNTTIVWTNELGKGNSHTLNNMPMVMLGNGLDFKMGRSLKFNKVAHNRLLMSFAHAFRHRIDRFGNPDYCGDGVITELT